MPAPFFPRPIFPRRPSPALTPNPVASQSQSQSSKPGPQAALHAPPVSPAPRVDVAAVGVSHDGMVLLPATSFRAMPAEIVMLRGENGAGKTTLLRTLAGVTAPTTGAVRVCGERVNERSAIFRKNVASMIGLPPLAPDLTVFDHLALVSATWEASAADAESAAHRVLQQFGCAPLSARYPHELSSGQTQLLGLALVFVRPSTVLLLDEPEQRLDSDRIELLAQALFARKHAGATIIVATHSERLSDAAADTVLTLRAPA